MRIRLFCQWAFSLAVGISSVVAESSSPPPQNFYGFQSEQLFAERKSEVLPVVSATKRGVYVQTENKPKRVSYRAVRGSKRKYYISNNLIQVRSSDFDYQFIEDGSYERVAMSQMQGLDFSYDVAISRLRHSGGDDITEQIAELESQRSEDLSITQEALEEGQPRVPGLNNSVIVSLELQAEHDIEDAFCALVISYVTAGSYSESEPETRKTIHSEFLGDIPGGVRHQVSVDFKLPLGEYDSDNTQLYIYNGNGQPVPTQQSRMLKELTPQEVLDVMDR